MATNQNKSGLTDGGSNCKYIVWKSETQLTKSTHVQTVILTAAVCTVGDSDGRDGRSITEIDVPIWSVLECCVGTAACMDAAAGEVVRVTVTVYSPAGDSCVGKAALERLV